MKSNNQINAPQAREAMDKFKIQAARYYCTGRWYCESY